MNDEENIFSSSKYPLNLNRSLINCAFLNNNGNILVRLQQSSFFRQFSLFNNDDDNLTVRDSRATYESIKSSTHEIETFRETKDVPLHFSSTDIQCGKTITCNTDMVNFLSNKISSSYWKERQSKSDLEKAHEKLINLRTMLQSMNNNYVMVYSTLVEHRIILTNICRETQTTLLTAYRAEENERIKQFYLKKQRELRRRNQMFIVIILCTILFVCTTAIIWRFNSN